MAGQYKSVFRGSGIEFEEVREYSPGDDVKTLDWKVSARLGKPYIKLYKEERESIVMLLIDMSASLNVGTRSGAKLDRAAEVASVLAFNAIKNNDKVGALFFTDQVEKYIPPQKGSGHIWRVIQEIFTFSPKRRQTNISAALDYLSKIMKKRSFVFILSDFLDQEYLHSLQMLTRRHEIIGILIHDTGGYRLPVKGIVSLYDQETGRELAFDAFSTTVKKKYFKEKSKVHRQTHDIFSKGRSDLIEMATSASVSETLLRYFRLREKRIR